MASVAELRRLALALPGAHEGPANAPQLTFGVVDGKGKDRGFAWSWMERIAPKKPRVANRGVLAILTPNVDDKDVLIAGDPDVFFTEPHYNGFPAVLVRLDQITVPVLRKVLADAHAKLVTPKPAKPRAKTVSKRTVAKRTVAKRK
jgi:hypothetical protein